MKKYIEKLHFITHDLADFSHLDQARVACESGAKWIQYRCLTKTDAEMLPEIIAIADICDDWGATLIVTEHIHLSKQADIQGFHLEDPTADLAAIKLQLGEEFTIGGTAHSATEVLQLVAAGADYIICGPFRASLTKMTTSEPLGSDGFKKLMKELESSALTVPLIATGGITAEDVPELLETGFFGIAASAAINQAPDMEEAYTAFYHQLR